MNPLLQDLETALVDYFAAIDQQKSATPPPLMPYILRLDELGNRLRPIAPPMLQHYLDRKSYGKALQFIRGEITEHQP